jgi:uncharacterized protein YcnI
VLLSLSRTTAGSAGLAAAAVVLLAGPALAHVTVQSPGATQGGYAKVTFRIPAEKPLATTKLQVVFPADAPLGKVRVKPHAGWSYVVATGKPAAPAKDAKGGVLTSVVQSITWTATDGGIEPGEFDEFDISAGPLPKVDQMTFNALQTYADGSVVRWAGDDAPVLKLAAPAADATSHGSSASYGSSASPVGSAPPAAAVTASALETDPASSSARGLSIAALAVAVAAAVLALASVLRGRRPAARP